MVLVQFWWGNFWYTRSERTGFIGARRHKIYVFRLGEFISYVGLVLCREMVVVVILMCYIDGVS